MMDKRARSTAARGQSSVMVLCMLMVFILIVGMVVDVGQAVNRRIALQVIADTGAYTGATVMAAGMNQLAYWNRTIQNLWGDIAIASGFWTTGPCFTLYTYITAYYLSFVAYASTYADFSVLAANRPQEVSDYNVKDLFPGEQGKVTYSEFSTDPLLIPGKLPGLGIVTLPVDDGTKAEVGWQDWGVQTPADLLPPAYLVPLVPDLQGTYIPKVWQCCTEPCIPFLSISLPVGFVPLPWFELRKLRDYYFTWVAKSPPIKALMFDSFFGPTAIPAMTAVAVAKPTGGNIKKGETRYVAKMLPVTTALPSGLFSIGGNSVGLVNDPVYGVRWVTH